MTDTVSVRDLRNDVSEVLRRAEAGERFIVTVSGRPVAELGPLNRRPRFLPMEQLEEVLRTARPDPALRDELKELTPDTTDDLDLPWDEG
jgi:prevent-host-death family protein